MLELKRLLQRSIKEFIIITKQCRDLYKKNEIWLVLKEKKTTYVYKRREMIFERKTENNCDTFK